MIDLCLYNYQFENCKLPFQYPSFKREKMSEELEYEINQRVTELAREMHEKEKSEFEQLQVQLERIDCKKVLYLNDI